MKKNLYLFLLISSLSLEISFKQLYTSNNIALQSSFLQEVRRSDAQIESDRIETEAEFQALQKEGNQLIVLGNNILSRIDKYDRLFGFEEKFPTDSFSEFVAGVTKLKQLKNTLKKDIDGVLRGIVNKLNSIQRDLGKIKIIFDSYKTCKELAKPRAFFFYRTTLLNFLQDSELENHYDFLMDEKLDNDIPNIINYKKCLLEKGIFYVNAAHGLYYEMLRQGIIRFLGSCNKFTDKSNKDHEIKSWKLLHVFLGSLSQQELKGCHFRGYPRIFNSLYDSVMFTGTNNTDGFVFYKTSDLYDLEKVKQEKKKKEEELQKKVSGDLTEEEKKNEENKNKELTKFLRKILKDVNSVNQLTDEVIQEAIGKKKNALDDSTNLKEEVKNRQLKEFEAKLRGFLQKKSEDTNFSAKESKYFIKRCSFFPENMSMLDCVKACVEALQNGEVLNIEDKDLSRWNFLTIIGKSSSYNIKLEIYYNTTSMSIDSFFPLYDGFEKYEGEISEDNYNAFVESIKYLSDSEKTFNKLKDMLEKHSDKKLDTKSDGVAQQQQEQSSVQGSAGAGAVASSVENSPKSSGGDQSSLVTPVRTNASISPSSSRQVLPELPSNESFPRSDGTRSPEMLSPSVHYQPTRGGQGAAASSSPPGLQQQQQSGAQQRYGTNVMKGGATNSARDRIRDFLTLSSGATNDDIIRAFQEKVNKDTVSEELQNIYMNWKPSPKEDSMQPSVAMTYGDSGDDILEDQDDDNVDEE